MKSITYAGFPRGPDTYNDVRLSEWTLAQATTPNDKNI